MKDLEFLNIMAQIRQVFGGESFIWRMNEEVGDMQEVWQGHRRRNSRSRTDGISSVDMKELCERFTFSMMQMSVPAWGLDQGRPRYTGPTIDSLSFVRRPFGKSRGCAFPACCLANVLSFHSFSPALAQNPLSRL